MLTGTMASNPNDSSAEANKEVRLEMRCVMRWAKLMKIDLSDVTTTRVVIGVISSADSQVMIIHGTSASVTTGTVKALTKTKRTTCSRMRIREEGYTTTNQASSMSSNSEHRLNRVTPTCELF